MPRDWGETIDLTISDDEDKPMAPVNLAPPRPPPRRTPVPLPANIRHLYPDPATSRPRQSPVPLPENVRHLVQTLPSGRSSPASANKPSPYNNTHARTPTASSSRPSSAMGSGGSRSNGQVNGVTSDYVPVFKNPSRGSADGSGFKEQAEKRRKVSVLGKQAGRVSPSLYPSKKPENGQTKPQGNGLQNGGFGAQRAGRDASPASHRNTASNARPEATSHAPLIQFGNKVPSTQSLNAALNSRGPKKPIAEDLLDFKPRALHIGRTSQEEEDVQRFYNARTKVPGTTAAAMTPTTAPSRRKSSSADAEMRDRDEDANMTLESFKPRRAPNTRPTLQNGRESTSSRQASFLGTATKQVQNEGSRDSVLLNSPLQRGSELDTRNSNILTPVPQRGVRKFANKFSEEEDHLIIFLKEVKKYSWRDLIPELPGRTFGTVQTHYSHKLNKRDRRLDPPRLNLPPKFAAESLVDWNTVHQNSLRPDPNRSLIQEAKTLIGPARRSPVIQHHDSFSQDNSSANESGPQRVRSRRAVPQVNYTWPRRNRLSRADADEDSVMDDVLPDVRDLSTPGRLSEAPDDISIGPDEVIPVDRPMSMDFEQEDASLAVSLMEAGHAVTPSRKLPYLSCSQRSVIRDAPEDGEWEQLAGRDWQGSVFHVDLNDEEQQIAELVITKILKPTQAVLSGNYGKRLRKLLKDLPEPRIAQMAYELRRKLFLRDQESINAFLEDAKNGKLRANPHIERLGAVRPNRKFSSVPKASTASLVRQRELGLQSRRGWKSACRPLSYQMHNNVQDSLGPAFSFTGASSDVHTVAWSPDGQCFAAGAVCVTDPDSMQYNRPNNLLYGDLTNRTMQELGEHSIPRTQTDAGPNSTHAMYVTQDPLLYTTISSVAFSPSGRYMYSAGYDHHACIWRISRDGSQPELVKALRHRAPVDILTVGCHGKVATAAKRWKANAIKVITVDEDNPEDFDRQSYTSTKAVKQPDMTILPTALQFEPNYGRLLLAGFGANSKANEHRLDTNGDICLWDVETQQQLNVHGSGKNVFDVAFNPNPRFQPLFAIGCVAGQNVNRGTRSVLRLYDGYDGKYSMVMELECAALDMNDVVWCPYDENLIAAGCTSGRTYIWDIRNPNTYLYALSHGRSLMPLHEDLDREVTDTGVRFLSWGQNATRLYSGSSDGVVKVWDVVGSPQDVFIKDLITAESGIMSGSLSPDKSKLIVGEVNGSINVLAVGRDDYSVKDAESFKYLPYHPVGHDAESDAGNEVTADADSGRTIAYKYLATGEMITVPMGGLPISQTVQGPNYAGPFDSSIDAPFLREQALEFQLNLATAPGPQCSIPSCADNNLSKMTIEETGDSGRSLDRIPDELRRQWVSGADRKSTVPGKAKCVDCGRPARPVESTSSITASPRCERCSFCCFRCGAINKVLPHTSTLTCTSCFRTWEIGALGYECIQERDWRETNPFKKGWMHPKKSSRKREKERWLEENVSYGDEINALTDYYLGLAIDRSESPPL